MAKKKLTAKQQCFADEYLVDLNATQAAIRAGYSRRTAYAMGAENLKKPQIASYIAERRSEIQGKTEITQQRIIESLAEIAFDKTTDFSSQGIPIVSGAKHKTASRIRALELLGRHLGVFERSDDSTGEGSMIKIIIEREP